MQLSPMDIRRHTFTKSFQGFDRDEVTHFVEMVAGTTEALASERDALSAQVSELKGSLEKYEKIERTLQEMLLQSQKTVEEARTNAERESMIIVREAEIRASEIKKSAERDLDEMKRSITILRDQKKIYLVKFRTLIKSQIEMLTLLETGEASGPRRPKAPEDPANVRTEQIDVDNRPA